MFSEITPEMLRRMKYLESVDERDRHDGTPDLQRLRQIPPETGKFIAILASNCPEGNFIEIGTSAGYSTMWISLATMERKIKIRTYEAIPKKIELAKETFSSANIEKYVELIEGDALDCIYELDNIAFCFLDAEKEIYEECWNIISPKMIKGGLLVADNAISHYEIVKSMIEKALKDKHFDCLVVPIDRGELVCRRK